MFVLNQIRIDKSFKIEDKNLNKQKRDFIFVLWTSSLLDLSGIDLVVYLQILGRIHNDMHFLCRYMWHRLGKGCWGIRQSLDHNDLR